MQHKAPVRALGRRVPECTLPTALLTLSSIALVRELSLTLATAAETTNWREVAR